MNFGNVLATDRFAQELFASAAKEQMLFFRSPRTELPTTVGGLSSQRALSLVVLFDRILIHELGPGELRIPDLEHEGIVQIVPLEEPLGKVAPLATTWKGSRRGSPPNSLLESLSRIQQLRPLVASRLVGLDLDFVNFVARKVGISRRQFIEQLLDYATVYAQGENGALKKHVINEMLPVDLVKDMTNDLFHFEFRDEKLDAVNSLLVAASLAADEIAIIRELSAAHGAPVATKEYGKAFRSIPALKGKEFDAVCAANRFLILQSALLNREPCMPHIDGIRHALSLRKNPYLKAMREHLKVLNVGLSVCDSAAIAEAAREIQRARHALSRRTAFDKPLAWLSYMSVPAAAVQPLLGTSILGLSVAVIGAASTLIGAAGTFTGRRIQHKNQWALFGS